MTYADVVARLGDDIRLPVFHLSEDGIWLECYLPAWAPQQVIVRLIINMQTSAPDKRIGLFFVTDCPRACLFGDWGEHAPEGTP